jgi:hypothetical protein
MASERVNVANSMELADQWGRLGSLRIERVILSPGAWKVLREFAFVSESGDGGRLWGQDVEVQDLPDDVWAQVVRR